MLTFPVRLSIKKSLMQLSEKRSIEITDKISDFLSWSRSKIFFSNLMRFSICLEILLIFF